MIQDILLAGPFCQQQTFLFVKVENIGPTTADQHNTEKWSMKDMEKEREGGRYNTSKKNRMEQGRGSNNSSNSSGPLWLRYVPQIGN